MLLEKRGITRGNILKRNKKKNIDSDSRYLTVDEIRDITIKLEKEKESGKVSSLLLDSLDKINAVPGICTVSSGAGNQEEDQPAYITIRLSEKMDHALENFLDQFFKIDGMLGVETSWVLAHDGDVRPNWVFWFDIKQLDFFVIEFSKKLSGLVYLS